MEIIDNIRNSPPVQWIGKALKKTAENPDTHRMWIRSARFIASASGRSDIATTLGLVDETIKCLTGVKAVEKLVNKKDFSLATGAILLGDLVCLPVNMIKLANKIKIIHIASRVIVPLGLVTSGIDLIVYSIRIAQHSHKMYKGATEGREDFKKMTNKANLYAGNVDVKDWTDKFKSLTEEQKGAKLQKWNDRRSAFVLKGLNNALSIALYTTLTALTILLTVSTITGMVAASANLALPTLIVIGILSCIAISKFVIDVGTPDTVARRKRKDGSKAFDWAVV